MDPSSSDEQTPFERSSFPLSAQTPPKRGQSKAKMFEAMARSVWAMYSPESAGSFKSERYYPQLVSGKSALHDATQVKNTRSFAKFERLKKEDVASEEPKPDSEEIAPRRVLVSDEDFKIICEVVFKRICDNCRSQSFQQEEEFTSRDTAAAENPQADMEQDAQHAQEATDEDEFQSFFELVKSYSEQEGDTSSETATEHPITSQSFSRRHDSASSETLTDSKMSVCHLIWLLPPEQLPRSFFLNFNFLTKLNLNLTHLEVLISIGDLNSVRHLETTYTPDTRLHASLHSGHKISVAYCSDLVGFHECKNEQIELRNSNVSNYVELESLPLCLKSLSLVGLKSLSLVGLESLSLIGLKSLVSAEIESHPESLVLADFSSASSIENDQEDSSRKPATEQPRIVKDANLEEKVGQVVQVADEEHKRLHEHLKELLILYSFLFPSDYEFRRNELVQLWIAEGFIGERETERMEETGIAYFKSLETEGFFEFSRCDFTVYFDSLLSVPMYNPSNFLYKVNPTKLSILENRISQGDCYRVVNGKLDGEMTQHLSLISEDMDKMNFGVLQKFKNLNTLIFLSGPGSSTRHVPHEFFLSLKFLRTLTLSGTPISELPSSIRSVKPLRYLDASSTPITRLPDTIDSLHNLQTIKLRGCVYFVQLPKGMKKLTNLRHVDLDIIRQLDYLPAHLGNLTKLQTLSAFLVGRDDGCGIGELKNLNDLKGRLTISRLENVSKKDAEEASLIDKKYLQRLELQWSNRLTKNTKEEEEILECLQPHSGLKELEILFYGGSILPNWISNRKFEDLVLITLYKSKNLKWLPSVGQLPALKFLSLIGVNEVREIDHRLLRNEQLQVSHAFPKLERLEIDIMLNLKVWKEIQRGDFPSLQKLVVDSCPKLDTLPQLSCLKLLKHLEFRRCLKLSALPSDGLPASLGSFIIIDCPVLKEQCHKGRGKDWSKICHVPSLWFDHEEVYKEELLKE